MPLADRILFVASQRQLKLSSDGLKTFTDVLSADGNIAEVVFAESDPNVVYCITEGSTFYRSEDAGGSFVRVVNIRSDVLNP